MVRNCDLIVKPNCKIGFLRADSLIRNGRLGIYYGAFMKILIIGSGGREYAIGRRLSQDSVPHELFFSPGNGATGNIGKNLEITDFKELAKWALNEKVELTIVGPEEPLSLGVADIFRDNGLSVFGCSKDAARLEGSKVFMKDFLSRHNIPTAKFINTSIQSEADKFIDEISQKTNNIVIKADGLCAGKGVIIAQSAEEAKKVVADMLSGNSFGKAGHRVVVEEFLDGFEISFFAICDGKNFVSLPPAQDHKRLLDNDKGPNTGGMGAYAPTPLATPELIKKIEKNIIKPTLAGMLKENIPFCGVLFAGIMVVDNEPIVLEFNVRFGDPECEVIMPLIDGELGDLLLSAAKSNLTPIKIKDKYTVGVVMASKNYPYSSSIAEEIKINGEIADAHIDFAGVSQKNSQLLASGGRVLVCVGEGDSIKQAHDKAYELCALVDFCGSQYRTDIAYQVLK